MRKASLGKRLAIPMLTLMLVVSQLTPEIANSLSNTQLVEIMNELPDTVIIAEATNYEKNFDESNVDWVKWYDLKYSSDFKYLKCAVYEDKQDNYVYEVYKTIFGQKYNQKLREEVVDYICEYNGYTTKAQRNEVKAVLLRNSLFTLTRTDRFSLATIITSKEGQKRLAEIGRKHSKYVTAKSDKTAAYETIAIFFGIVNNDYKVATYNPNAKISRLEWEAMYVTCQYTTIIPYYDQMSLQDARWSKEDAAHLAKVQKDFGANNKYIPYIMHMSTDNLERPWGEPCYSYLNYSTKDIKVNGWLTKSELYAPVTKGEVLYRLGLRTLNPSDTYTKTSYKKIKEVLSKEFKDINSKTFCGDTGWNFKQEQSHKQIKNETTTYIWWAYNAGIFKPNSNGNAGLFKGVTYREAITMLIDCAVNKQYLQPNYGGYNWKNQ